MVHLYFVSYTLPEGDVVLDLHIGTKPVFVKKGLQLVTTDIKVNNIFMHLDERNTL